MSGVIGHTERRARTRYGVAKKYITRRVVKRKKNKG
jgi:hypothetical protein